MHSQGMAHHTVWKPFSMFGLTSSFWNIETDTIVGTWCILGIITVASLLISRCLKNQKSLVRWIVIQYVQTFQELLIQALKTCSLGHLTMIGTLFTFIMLCNTIQIIPWLEEPTKDLNTTFALGLLSFLYVHGSSIRHKGLRHYIAHYFEPFFLMAPLHVVGAISSIISLSFRLFGNIYGGFTINYLYSSMMSGSIVAQTIGIISGGNIIMLLLFGICEGLIQAFVFTMLTTTYLSMELTSEDQDSHEGAAHD